MVLRFGRTVTPIANANFWRRFVGDGHSRSGCPNDLTARGAGGPAKEKEHLGAGVQHQVSQAGGDRHPAEDEAHARLSARGGGTSKQQTMVLEIQGLVEVSQELLSEDSPDVRRQG